ncbi:Hint domain-containing protein [Roseicyclus sp.]|uniref:Hint domain-containing protein n=1 Tax=Roseicyclus sp. TaxID=1914329 RepID=UPI003F6CE1B8
MTDAAGAGSGALTTDDSFSGGNAGFPNITGGVYTGFYIPISFEGTTYNLGVFTTNHSTFNYCIPYDTALLPFDLFPMFPTTGNGSTSVHAPNLSNAANCFLTGTRIATPHGLRAIETLQPDDLVLTADGRIIPIIWVWRQEIVNIQVLAEALTPILISTGAFGPDRPVRDLVVTADHAIALSGLLINAGALVDGIAIHRLTPAQMPARYSYWHIETAAHELLLAENCAAESYVDYALRQGFDNYDAYLARYGTDRPIAEMALPRISAARLVPQMLRHGLGARCLA